jgi:hypothetical protein
MAAGVNPAATDYVPVFFSAPDGSDVLMVVVGVILVLSVLCVGLLFLRLHTLPERIAHKRQKFQFEIVAVLGLLALFTHIHMFWVAGLVLALIDLPDFGGFFSRITHALEAIASNTGRIIGPAENFPKPASGSAPLLSDSSHPAKDLTDA